MLQLPRSFAGAQDDKWEAGRIARNARNLIYTKDFTLSDYETHRPLKGKRLTTFCASLALLHPLLSLTHWIFGSLMLPYKSSSLEHPLLSLTHWIFGSLMLPYKSSSLEHPLLSLTHWIFRSLMLPYKSSSHSAKCVRCAPRSGNPPPSAAEPLSPPERSDATLLHNPRRSRAPFLQNLRRQPPPPPSEPCEPSEPFEPGPRSGPIEALFSPATKHRDILENK